MTLALFPVYCAGTMIGSVYGAKISMRIESWLGATADGHVKKKTLTEDDVERIVQERLDALRACANKKCAGEDTQEFPRLADTD